MPSPYTSIRRAWYPEDEYIPKVEYEIDDTNIISNINIESNENNNNNNNDNSNNDNDNNDYDNNNDGAKNDPYDDIPVNADEADAPKEEPEYVPTRPWFALADMLKPSGKAISSEPARDLLEPVFVYGYSKHYIHNHRKQRIQRTLFYSHDRRIVFPSTRYVLSMEKIVGEYDTNECHWGQRVLHGHHHPISAVAMDRNRQTLVSGKLAIFILFFYYHHYYYR